MLERDGYLVFPMRHCTELNAASMHERWVHGTQFSSLWNILGHGNAVASLGDAEALTGVWTSTKPVCLESYYSCLSHIGLGVTVRLALLLRPLGKNAHEAYKHIEKGPAHQRVIRQFRVRVEAIALKEETIGEGTSAVAGNLLSHNPATQLWNPVLEVNPHSAEVGWIRHGASRVALTIGAEIPAGSVAREASVPPAKPGGEVLNSFLRRSVISARYDAARCLKPGSIMFPHRKESSFRWLAASPFQGLQSSCTMCLGTWWRRLPTQPLNAVSS